MTSGQYPLHDKIYENREKIDAVIAFVDSLPGNDHEIHYVHKISGHCVSAIPLSRMIYAWLDIEPAALEAEKRQMVEELRSSQPLP